MKNIKQITLILVIIAVVSITVAALLLFVSNGYNIDASEYQVSENKMISFTNISSIEINTVSTSIEIVESNSENIEVYLTGQTTSKINEVPELTVTKEDNTLKIAVEYKNLGASFFNFGGMHDMNLQLKIPRNKVGMDITTVSGDLEVSNFEFADFKFKGTSADAVINNITSYNFNFNTVSGGLKAVNIETGEVVTETTSGDVSFNSLKSGSLNAKSVSGKVNLDYVELTNDIDIKTTSGDVKVKLPADSSFVIDFDSTSGDLENRFAGMTTESVIMVNGGEHRFVVRTTSGDLDVFN